jgi:hypothetical protein
MLHDSMKVINSIAVAPDALDELSGMVPDGSPIVLNNRLRSLHWAIDPPGTRHEKPMGRPSW